MKLDEAGCRRLFASAPVARLATTGPAGPHVVPIVFVVAGDSVVTVVDAKPKTTTRLQRIRNLEHDPRAAILVDHYATDWAKLWWVRADASATIDDSTEGVAVVLSMLQQKYPHYVDEPPGGPVIRFHIMRWTGWAASQPAAER